jgi:hypothetical protein
MKINIAGQDEYTQPVRVLIVGQSDVTKARFAATAPNALWVTANADSTMMSRLGVKYTSIASINDLLEVKLAVDRSSEERKELFGFDVDTLVFDSVDELQRRILDEHLLNDGRSETKIEDWSWVSKTFHNIFAAFGALETNLIFLTGVKDIPVSESETWIKPSLQGAFADQIHRYTTHSLLLRVNSTGEEPVSVSVDASEAEVHIQPETKKSENAFLVTRPVSYAEWIKDSTESLPFRLWLDFENDFNNIIALRDGNEPTTESDSISLDVSEKTEDDPEQQEQSESDISETTEAPSETEKASDSPICDECGAVIDSGNWVLLSSLRGWPNLCKKHFVAKQKNS